MEAERLNQSVLDLIYQLNQSKAEAERLKADLAKGNEAAYQQGRLDERWVWTCVGPDVVPLPLLDSDRGLERSRDRWRDGAYQMNDELKSLKAERDALRQMVARTTQDAALQAETARYWGVEAIRVREELARLKST